MAAPVGRGVLEVGSLMAEMVWMPHAVTRVRYRMPKWSIEEMLADLDQAGLAIAPSGPDEGMCLVTDAPSTDVAWSGRYHTIMATWGGWQSWYTVATLWLWMRRYQALHELLPTRDLAGPSNPWRAR